MLSKFIVGEQVKYSYRSGDWKKIFDICEIDAISITKDGLTYNVFDVKTGECFFNIRERDLWKIKKDYSEEAQRKLDSIRWQEKRKRKLNRDEVEWIFAMKDGSVKAHYNLNYGRYEDQPTEHTVVTIMSEMMDRIGWEEAIRGLRQDHTMHTILRKKNEMPLSEWLYLAIRNWCIHRDIYWLQEHAGPHWNEWVRQARESWKKEEEAQKNK